MVQRRMPSVLLYHHSLPNSQETVPLDWGRRGINKSQRSAYLGPSQFGANTAALYVGVGDSNPVPHT